MFINCVLWGKNGSSLEGDICHLRKRIHRLFSQRAVDRTADSDHTQSEGWQVRAGRHG